MENNSKIERLNAQYQAASNTSANISLLSFLRKEPVNGWLLHQLVKGPWLELGCGSRSQFEEGDQILPGLRSKSDLYAMDLSNIAIERAKGNCHYQVADLAKEIPGGPYSFILDGHFLHCLSSFPEVFSTLGHIMNALMPGGLYAGEVMTAHKNLSFDSDLFFDYESSVLYRGDSPLRFILDARAWEDLFLSAGFEISYFVCQASIKMIPNRERNVPMSGDPECLRFVLKRPIKESENY